MAHFNFQDRQIGLFVDPNDLGGVLGLFPVQRDLNLGGLIHDVIVRQDEALLVDDHARAQAALGLRALIRKIEEAVEKVLKRLLVLILIVRRTQLAAAIALPWRAAPFSTLFDHLRGRNIYDRRLHLFHNRGKGARQLHGVGNRQRRSAHGQRGMRRADMAGNHRANDHADGQRQGDQQRRQNLSIAHPSGKFSKLHAHNLHSSSAIRFLLFAPINSLEIIPLTTPLRAPSDVQTVSSEATPPRKRPAALGCRY